MCALAFAVCAGSLPFILEVALCIQLHPAWQFAAVQVAGQIANLGMLLGPLQYEVNPFEVSMHSTHNAHSAYQTPVAPCAC